MENSTSNSEQIVTAKWKMIRHLKVSIDGFLANFKRKNMGGLIEKEDGTTMNDRDARIYLAECKAKGWKYLPTADCEGFDHFDKGCPGHIVYDEQ
jgi:hypothetical protein